MIGPRPGTNWARLGPRTGCMRAGARMDNGRSQVGASWELQLSGRASSSLGHGDQGLVGQEQEAGLKV